VIDADCDAMGKRRKSKDVEEREVTFDPKSRQEFITGFKKRKDARRKVGMREIMNRCRQDKIDVQREHREEIKKRWKDVLWAERTVDRVLLKRAALMQEKQQQLSLEDGVDGGKKRKALALKANGEGGSDDESDGLEAWDDGGDGWIPQEIMDAENERLPALTVSFAEEEDDDPFGGCEVTTTAVALNSASSAAAADMGQGLETNFMTLAQLEERCNALARLGADGPMTAEELEEHRRRRAINIKKDEARRMKAMDRQMKRDVVEKRRMRKKSSKNKTKKDQKAGAKQRRRRKKKAPN